VNYVFLDEIQEIKNFENCVITLFENKKIKFDIVLTGSNSKMFSDELGSLFTGRYLEIHVFPFSFHEYFEYFKINDISFASVNDMFEQYIQYGGLPILLSK
jgi:predicted AAA+ superfamily ATPase